jgi:hypothetical protein
MFSFIKCVNYCFVYKLIRLLFFRTDEKSTSKTDEKRISKTDEKRISKQDYVSLTDFQKVGIAFWLLFNIGFIFFQGPLLPVVHIIVGVMVTFFS